MNPTAAPPAPPKRDSGTRAIFGADPLRHTRLLLQSEGPESARRHLLRSLTRVITLIALDSGSYVTVRAFIRLLRDDALLGSEVASQVYTVFPRGSLGGIQFVTALSIGLFAFGAYGRGDSRRDPARILHGVVFAAALTLWTDLWVQSPLIVIGQGILITAVMWSAVTMGRLLFEVLIQFVFPTSPDTEPVVFVGERSDTESARVHRTLMGPKQDRTTEWVEVPLLGSGRQEPVERTVQRIHAALKAASAHSIVLCGDLPKPTFEAIVETASSAGIRVLARVSGVVQRRVGFVWYNGTPFVELTVPGLLGWQLMVKRLLDFAVAFVGLVFLAPVFAAVAIAVKRDSHGPVFFRQERVGYAGSVFRVWKFRTMRSTAEQEKASLSHLNASGDQRLFKIPDDPRVTRVGAFLRRWSLDELPQFFNVLNGEMSLVGPRPFFPSDLKGYLDHHFARLGAKPGITGLWQVKGRSTVTDFEEVVRLDREYIERWSVLLDLGLLLRTIPVVLRGRGAY